MNDPVKAYKNLDFLNSPAARTIRMVCEYEEPRQRFLRHRVRDTIVFFGSARAVPEEQARGDLADAQRELVRAEGEYDRLELERKVRQSERRLRLSRYYDDSRELARRLTEWDMKRKGRRRYYVCTGGGPGTMEAANRGAADVVGGRSVGLRISLPFEEKLNSYVPKDLSFEFHYFFMRKYWFLYLAKAMVFMPGGFGTMDEMFETVTLCQTGKVHKALPMVLFGTEYWNDVFRVDKMVEWGTISEKDVHLFHRTDDLDDAFDYLVELHVAAEEREALSRRDGEDRPSQTDAP